MKMFLMEEDAPALVYVLVQMLCETILCAQGSSLSALCAYCHGET